MSHFYVSNMKLDETPRFWYPHIDRNVWIDISSQNIELLPSKCRENLLFFFSLSLFVCFPSVQFFTLLFFSFLAFLPFPFYFFSLVVLSYPIELSFFYLFAPLSFFFIFSFSLIFSSLSFPSFSLFFFSFGLHQPNGPKSGKLPPHFLLRHLSFS